MWKANSYRVLYALIAIMLATPLILSTALLLTPRAAIVAVGMILGVLVLCTPERTPAGRDRVPGVVMVLCFLLAIVDVVWMFNMIGGLR